MTPETTVILLTLILAFISLGIPAVIRVANVGIGPLLGSRDNIPPVDSVYFQRADRANQNLKETLPWALALLILVQVTEQANATTAMGAWLYFGARSLYLPLYIFGVPVARTLAWAAALVGLVFIALQLCS